MTLTTRSGRCAWLFAAASACLSTTLHAQTAVDLPKIDSGDNAWMLVSAALVLMMTAPGLALFYGGLVRPKNVLATMMQSFFLISLVSLLWFAFGYGMAPAR